MGHFRKGFTLIELMIAVAIISVLSVLAVSAYKGYQELSLEKEATAAMFSIANDAQRLIQDWGLSTLGGGIQETCYPAKPASLEPNTAVEWDRNANDLWTQNGIFLTGSQHWRYRLCFYTDSNKNENYFVSANLILTDKQRVAVLYSGLDKPMFDVADAPDDCDGWSAELTSSE